MFSINSIHIGLLVGIVIGSIILILGLVFTILCLCKKKKKPRIKVDAAFIQTLLDGLGGKENISAAKNINGRVHIDVQDLEIVQLEDLKQLSTAGVFVTNQTIKLLFSYDSDTIVAALLQK